MSMHAAKKQYSSKQHSWDTWRHMYNGSYKASKMDSSPITNHYVYKYHVEILVKSMVK